MVRTADDTWRMSYRSFCLFHQILKVIFADRLGGLPTSPGFVDGSLFRFLVCGTSFEG